MDDDSGKYSEQETIRPRDAVIKQMLSTPPKPHSEMKIGKSKKKVGKSSQEGNAKSRKRIENARIDEMTKSWDDMTADKKLEWLRQNIENLRGHLMQFAAEMESSQRGLNNRIVQLEQAHERLERRPPKGG